MTDTQRPRPDDAERIQSDAERVAALLDLRAPFADEAISRKPTGGVQLAYVGHAHATERLLEVDPFWTWEPVAYDEHGLPCLDRDRNGNPVGLWLKLTVCGVTRLGYGSCKAGANEAVKELIGDAIRNAAMRFGVALDLWKREASFDNGGRNDNRDNRGQRPAPGGGQRPPQGQAPTQRAPQNGQRPPQGQAPNGQPPQNAQPSALGQLTQWCADRSFCLSSDDMVYPKDVANLLHAEGFRAEVTAGNLEEAKRAIERRYTHNNPDNRRETARQMANGA